MLNATNLVDRCLARGLSGREVLEEARIAVGEGGYDREGADEEFMETVTDYLQERIERNFCRVCGETRLFDSMLEVMICPTCMI